MFPLTNHKSSVNVGIPQLDVCFLSACELEKRKLAESEMKGNLICDVKRNNDDKCLLQAISTVVELATSAFAFRNSQRSAICFCKIPRRFWRRKKTKHVITSLAFHMFSCSGKYKTKKCFSVSVNQFRMAKR